jgi:hypothetical protein
LSSFSAAFVGAAQLTGDGYRERGVSSGVELGAKSIEIKSYMAGALMRSGDSGLVLAVCCPSPKQRRRGCLQAWPPIRALGASPISLSAWLPPFFHQAVCSWSLEVHRAQVSMHSSSLTPSRLWPRQGGVGEMAFRPFGLGGLSDEFPGNALRERCKEPL